MSKKNPFKKGTLFHFYYDIFVDKIAAPSASDLVKRIYIERGHLITVNSVHSFRSRLRTGRHPQLNGECITNIALQPYSCSPKELERWVSENVT